MDPITESVFAGIDRILTNDIDPEGIPTFDIQSSTKIPIGDDRYVAIWHVLIRTSDASRRSYTLLALPESLKP